MIRFLRRYAVLYLWQLCAIFLLGLLQVGASLAFVWYSKLLIDGATQGQSEHFWLYSGVVIALILFQISLSQVGTYIGNSASTKMGNHIRRDLYEHMLYVRWDKLKAHHSADILTRLMRDVDDVVTLLLGTIPGTVLAIIQLIATTIFLYFLNPILTVAVIVASPILLGLSKVYFKKMRVLATKAKETDSQLNSHLQETLSNPIVVRSFEYQAVEVSKFFGLQTDLYDLTMQRTKISIFSRLMFSLAFNGGYVGTFLWSGYLLMLGKITFGSVTAYLQLVRRIQGPIQSLTGVIPILVSAKSSIDRLKELIEIPQESKEMRFVEGKNFSLRVKDLSFRYTEEDDWIYRDFSMQAHEGSMVAIMGRTGAGKTTLIRLLLGLVQPSRGKIYIKAGGREHLVDEETRGNFIYVPQGGSLFSGTIRDNLLVGKPDASDEELKEVLHMAVADFVFELPNGLDTLVGERGVGLSEGQAQRIAIARSLLRSGQIMLLDEATSALDEATERIFLNNLKEHYRDKIILFITHHLAVRDLCDEVIEI